MEQDKDNKKIEELSDEQLKKVAGEFSSECFHKEHDCFEIEDCDQRNSCLENLNQNGCKVPIPKC